MFDRAVAALKAAEQAIVADLDQLWVPFDPATGSGGLHWHGAGAGALIEGYKSVVGIRASLEAKEPPTPAAESVTPEEAPSVPDETVSVPDPTYGGTFNPSFTLNATTTEAPAFAGASVAVMEAPAEPVEPVVESPEPTAEPEPEVMPEAAEAPAEESVTEVEDGA